MGFKSDSQRKGFFSNLRNNLHESSLKRHELQREKILKKATDEKIKLRKQQESFESEAKVRQAKKQLQTIKAAETRIKQERFAKSRTGRFVAASRKGASHVVEYERKHAKGQMKQLRKLGKQFK